MVLYDMLGLFENVPGFVKKYVNLKTMIADAAKRYSNEVKQGEVSMKWFLRSKIHRAVVTDANVDYIGSISVDKELMDKVGLVENEKVTVWNITNSERI